MYDLLYSLVHYCYSGHNWKTKTHQKHFRFIKTFSVKHLFQFDLWIYIFENLKWNQHVNCLYKVASVSSFQILKIFKTNTATLLTKSFKIYVRPKLEFNTQIWSSYFKKDINKIESVQINFTRFICNRCNIPNKSYKDR